MDDRSPAAAPDAVPEASAQEMARALSSGEGLQALARELLRDAAHADDLAQDAWLVIANEPRGVRDPSAWLVGVVRNLDRTRARRERARRWVEEQAARAEKSPAPDVELEHSDFASELRRRVRALPEPYGSVLDLHYLDELSTREIGRRLGRREGTVRSQLARGLVLLRERLSGSREFERGRWVLACVRLGFDVDGTHAVPPPRSMSSPATWVSATAGVALLVAVAWIGASSDGRSDADLAGLAGPAANAERAAGDPPLEVETRAVSSGPRAAEGNERVVAAVSTPASQPPASASTADGPPWSASVRVLDEHGAPAAEVLVSCVREGIRRTLARTDARGEARFEFGVEDLSSDVTVFAPNQLALLAEGPRATTSLLVCGARARFAAGPLTLRLARGGVALRGVVLDARGLPVAGAEIHPGETISQRIELEEGVVGYESSAIEFTDSSGLFQLRANPGEFALRVRRAGGPLTRFVEHVPAGAQHECTLRLEAGHELRGTLRLPSGAPAAGARVYLDELACDAVHGVRAGSDGSFVLRDIVPGTHGVCAELGDGLARLRLEAQPAGASTWDATLDAFDGLRVRIVDERARPRPNWCVLLSASSWRRMAATNAGGWVEMLGVPDEPLELVSAPVRRWVPYPMLERYDVRARQGSVELAISDAEALAGTLRGRLLHGDTRACSERARAFLRRVDRRFVSDFALEFDDGVFRIEGLPCGDYALGLSFDDLAGGLAGYFDAGRASVRSGAVDSDAGTLTLPERGVLDVSAGAPDASLEWELASRSARARFDREPVVCRGKGAPPTTLELLPGEYELRLLAGEARIASAAVRVIAGARTRVELARASASEDQGAPASQPR